MAKKADIKAAKRKAVVARLKEMEGNFDLLSGMWDEPTLDTIILILGIGHVEIDAQ